MTLSILSFPGSEYIPVPVMEDDNVTVVAVDKEGHKGKDLLSWKSLRDINESLAPLFTVTNPNTGTIWFCCSVECHVRGNCILMGMIRFRYARGPLEQIRR